MKDPLDAARKQSTRSLDTLVSAVQATAWNELSLGDELGDGRFAVERLLGRGGMGVVYQAKDRARSLSVALKTLDVYDAPALHGIKREFRALSDIYHPNLVRLHELFVENERCFFTMDLVDGVDFLAHVRREAREGAERRDLDPTSRIMDRDPMPWRRTRRAVPPSFDLDKLRPALEQLCGAVVALHNAGKLHRDLKPSNVLVTGTGQLVILDFGLAFDQFRDNPNEQVFGGTPFYMAPELLSGGAASPASDWYAVGVMLYEALTGRDPFFGVGADLLWEKREHDPLWPSEFARDVPGELEVLCMRLLKRNPAQRPDAAEILGALGLKRPSAPPASDQRGAPHDLLGRDRHVASLRAAFEKCRSTRRPLVVFLGGTSGLGKTWLLEHAARELRDEARILFGRCHEREWVPHKAFDQVVDGLARALKDRKEDLLQLEPDHAQAVGSVFPILQALDPIFDPKDQPLNSANPREVRRRAYLALKQLFSILCKDGDLIIAIDDLHWGDIDSARLLAELFAGEDAPPCLLIATFRDDEALSSACLTRLLGNERPLSDLVETWQLSLDELDAEQSKLLAASLLERPSAEAPRLLEAVCAEANGNPLLIRELMSHVNASGASEKLGLSEVVRARLARLEPSERLMFELVCVAGSPLSQNVISQAAGVDEAIAGRVLRLQSERLIRERTSLRPDAIDVFHDRIRLATLSELDEAAIRDRHLALALAHERLGAAEPEALARHYAGAGQASKAAGFAELAADASAKVLALNRAAELYRMAYELGTDQARKSELRIKLAIALSDAGRGGEAAPLFLEAAASATESEALELRRRAAEQFLVSGHTDRGLEVLGTVLEAVGLELPRTPRAALFDLVLTRSKLGLRGLRVTPRPRAALDPKRLLRADACKASWALSFVNTIQGAAFQARFLHAALASGEPCRIALGLGMEAIYTSTEGGGREARVHELRRAARELAKQLDDPHVEAFEAMVEGQTSYMFGRWQNAVKALERAERILTLRCRNVTWELNSSRFFWGNSLIYFGRWRELSRRLQAWQDDAIDRGDLYAESTLRLTQTRSLTLADDAPELALSQIDAALALWKSSEFGVQRFLADLSRVQIALYRRDPARAVTIMERMWPEFSSSLMKRVQLSRIHAFHHGAYSTLALAAATGDRALLRKAAKFGEKLEREAMPWARAFASYVTAAVAQLRGDSEAAVSGLRDAAEAFEGCQMHFYGSACSIRLGTLIGGDEGAELVRTAGERFRAQGVLRPERIVSMMAPGFSEA